MLYPEGTTYVLCTPYTWDACFFYFAFYDVEVHYSVDAIYIFAARGRYV
mgnify:FL=1